MPANSFDARKTRDPQGVEPLQQLPVGLVPGLIVTARGTRWNLDARISHADCCELHLSRTADAARRILLWPFDRPVPIRQPRHLEVVSLRRWIRLIAAAAGQAIDPATPRAQKIAADILPYQLAPA